MVTLNRVKIIERCKKHSKRVKITPKTSQNHSQNECKSIQKESGSSKKSENHSTRVNFTFWGKLTEGQLFSLFGGAPSVSSQKIKINSF